MKPNTLALTGTIVLLAAVLVVGIFKIQLASAQADATSTDPVAEVSTSTPPVEPATTTPDSVATEQAVESFAPATTEAPVPATAPVISGATPKLVKIVGTKYVDYFTDGGKIVSFPGDPAIDDNLNKSDAQIPVHAGLTWVSTAGVALYDTPSGNLEIGNYAQQADGSFVGHVGSSVYTDATSTATLSDRVASFSSETEIKDKISKASGKSVALPPAPVAPPTAKPVTKDVTLPSDTGTSSPATTTVSTSI